MIWKDGHMIDLGGGWYVEKLIDAYAILKVAKGEIKEMRRSDSLKEAFEWAMDQKAHYEMRVKPPRVKKERKKRNECETDWRSILPDGRQGDC